MGGNRLKTIFVLFASGISLFGAHLYAAELTPQEEAAAWEEILELDAAFNIPPGIGDCYVASNCYGMPFARGVPSNWCTGNISSHSFLYNNGLGCRNF